jgi:hypothetical protein
VAESRSARPVQLGLAGRRQTSSTTAAPRHRNHATAAGDAIGNKVTAPAAPAYIEIPLRTNKTGAGTAPKRLPALSASFAACCLTSRNDVIGVKSSYPSGCV